MNTKKPGATFVALAIALAISAVTPSAAWAHEGHVHKVLGTVVSVDAKRIEVETRDGKKAAYALTPETKYVGDRVTAGPADVKAGSRVVLSVVEKAGRTTVTEVRLGAAPKAGSK